ncbi:unnamed protein product [Acidithrix sp. C25]|nr:unnamed protein product [Acidithrix sp. C25]
MLGVSYLAMSQYKVAAGPRPVALKAICPWEGFTDGFRDFLSPGGITERGLSRLWVALTKRFARIGIDIAKKRREHPLRDSWWNTITPDLANITIPILVCASFSDSNLHSTGSMRAFTDVSSVERHVYTHRSPKWSTFYGEEARTYQWHFSIVISARCRPLPFLRYG